MQTSQQDPAQADRKSRLCLECGLCCNGVLFGDVRIVEGDDALMLEKKGFRLKQSEGKTTFAQPCACFDGRSCTAYKHRPIRCQRFDCHTLKQALNHKIGHSEAMARIRNAKREAETVRRLLRSLGQTDEHLPLTKRYQAVMSQPIDLSTGEEGAEQRGELMLAVNDLMGRLHRDFLVVSADES